jgi:putative flavoprotein involved in K+ transport
MPPETVETLIIGGGQAGLTMSHMLSQRGRPHLVLERRRIAERWRTERWDGLRFQFPNWAVRLPDFPFPHADPDAFAPSGAIVCYLEAYADFIAAPVRCGVTVTALRRQEATPGFLAETPAGPVAAQNIVVATGPYQRPLIPPLFPADASVVQVHASGYRAPEQLPDGAVLIVGSGASGAQISEELLRAGRHVYLSVGRHRRMPRRYRGRDLIWWLSALGLDETRVEDRGPERPQPLITGALGGYTIDLRDFAARGVTLLGRLERAHGVKLEFSPGLAGLIADGDATYMAFLDMVDAHIERQGLNLSAEPAARAVHPDPPCLLDPITSLDMRAAGIGSIIWATGYGVDFGWIDIPVFDARGAPLHRAGITGVPGLYFLGLPWLAKLNSSFLSGVGDDAAHLAGHIAARR